MCHVDILMDICKFIYFLETNCLDFPTDHVHHILSTVMLKCTAVYTAVYWFATAIGRGVIRNNLFGKMPIKITIKLQHMLQ